MVRRPAVRDLLARRNAGVPQWPMADLQRFDGTTDLDPADLAAALDADGACIVERLIDTTVTAAIRAELAPHIDLTPNGDTKGSLVNGDDSRFIEFYNLVFMEYNRDAEGNLTALENKNIDTGWIKKQRKFCLIKNCMSKIN